MTKEILKEIETPQQRLQQRIDYIRRERNKYRYLASQTKDEAIRRKYNEKAEDQHGMLCILQHEGLNGVRVTS